MQMEVYAGKPATAAVDLVVWGIFVGDLKEIDGFAEMDAALGGALSSAALEQDFSGKPKQQLMLHTLGKLSAKRIALVGLGARPTQDPQCYVQLGGVAARLGNQVAAKEVVVVLPAHVNASATWSKDVLALAARGAALGAYRFDQYKSDKGRVASLQKVSFSAGKNDVNPDQLRHAQILSESVALARDWVNEPPSALFPAAFAERTELLAHQTGLHCVVYTPDKLQDMGLNLLLAVGQGSAHEPRMVHLTYEPVHGADASKSVALIGKGITFDSGGLCLKDPANMMDMKMDMSGAAAVVATMVALAKLKPSMTVHAVVALAENMPSGTAYRLGDVIKSGLGKTVEINNTDAEGRLVLADALHFISQYKPSRMIDLATLTGACVVALGPHTTGLFSNDDALANDLLTAAKRAGEDFWRMPLTTALRDQLKSEIADMRNTGERYGGAITAALFLKEFVGETPWAHLDIAGPATTTDDSGAMSKGGTGIGVATLVELLWRGNA